MAGDDKVIVTTQPPDILIVDGEPGTVNVGGSGSNVNVGGSNGTVVDSSGGNQVIAGPGAQGAPGPPGPRGLKGDQGDQGVQGLSAYQLAVANGFTGTEDEWLSTIVHSSYRHVQSVATDEWVVHHGLGFIPNVTVVDSSGRTVIGAIEHIDENELVVRFNAPFGGTIHCS